MTMIRQRGWRTCSRKPITITTGTSHSKFTVDGNISDHFTGHAADIGMAANGGTNDGPVGDHIMEAGLEGMEAGALGLSVSRNKGHYDPQGVHIPALWADEKEIFALADVLREMGTGIIQSGGGREAELSSGLMARLSEATGRPVVYNNLGQTVRRPDEWKQLMKRVDETTAQGIRAYPCARRTARRKASR